MNYFIYNKSFIYRLLSYVHTPINYVKKYCIINNVLKQFYTIRSCLDV